MVVLHKLDVEARNLPIVSSVVRLEKKTAFVTIDVGFENENAGKLGTEYFHQRKIVEVQ